jgi:Tol biopolymer transport system component/DNA-binding winged helix-turn-helix (wHTH) protein
VTAPIFEFDQFELNVHRYELRRAGRRIRLQRVPMDLLILLIERNGALVTRAEIVARLWSPDVTVDTQSSINTAVRKIRQALDDNGEEARFVETVVGKGYRFIAEVSTRRQSAVPAEPRSALETPPPLAPQPVAPASFPKRWAILSGLAAVILICAIGFLLGLTQDSGKPMRITPFTALAGSESWPVFSPDGNRVAFAWTGEKGDTPHIYVTAVDGGSPVKLSEGPAADSSPSWSPDGRFLAFLRRDGHGKLALCAIPASGGDARSVANLIGPTEYRPAWTPDGKSIVVMHSDPPQAPASLFVLGIDSGLRRRLTTAGATSTGDWCPVFSPDGRTLAYLHNTGSVRQSPLFILPVDSRGFASGDPRPIESGSAGFIDFDWSADGRSFVCTTPSGLVRVPLSGGAAVPLPFLAGGQPTVARLGSRLIYQQPYRDTDIFRVPGPGASGAITRLISSTRQESAPQYSPDGRRIVFVSDRTGSDELWIIDSEGQQARQITSFGGPSVGSPRWSLDGRQIAFDSAGGGDVGIYLVASEGGTARRITTPGISCVRPSWSRNGNWIYFGSNRSGVWEIWKTTPQGGSPVQVTHAGGREAFEDPEGKFVYYSKAPPLKGIWRIPSGGGEETNVSRFATQGRWAMGGRGLYYLKAPDQLEFLDLSTMDRVPLPTPGLQIGEGVANLIAAGANDRWILLTVLIRSDSQLTLVRNFR